MANDNPLTDEPRVLQYYVQLTGGGQVWQFPAREVRGTEHISRPWRLEIAFALKALVGLAEALDPDDVVREPIAISLMRNRTVERVITGIVTDISVTATAAGTPEVRLIAEPRMSLLRHRSDVRIHRNLTVPQIVTEVCEALGVTVRQELEGSYDARPYCVQWRETDFDYVSRLLEDEGIHYYFDDDDVLVLGDHAGAYRPIAGEPTVPLRQLAGLDEHHDAVFHFGQDAQMQPGKVTLRDWHVDHPTLDMDVTSDTSDGQGPEWYDYPGEYETPAEGSRKARLVAEAFSCAALKSTAQSTCARLMPGAHFVLAGGVQSDALVVRKVVHEWDRVVGGFALSIEAQPQDVVYRPPRTTYVPRLLNPHTGTVCVSSPGEDIHCDRLGRVKVHFHWDRLRPYDDDCSDWVPVLQDNTGGSSAIPREGWEVLVHYLEGDPDRPVVLGRSYNGKDRPDERLPNMKAQSALRSLTTPTRDGGNSIRFDDLQGTEKLMVSAERDQRVAVANDQTASIGASEVTGVGNNEQISIGGDATWKVGGSNDENVGANQTWSVGGNRTFDVKSLNELAVFGDRKLDVGGNFKGVLKDQGYIAAMKMDETFGGNLEQKATLSYDTIVRDTLELTIGGNVTETVKTGRSLSANVKRIEKIGGNLEQQSTEGEHQIRVDKKRTTTIKGNASVKATKMITLTGAHRLLSKSLASTYTADTTVTFKVGDTHVTMKNGLISIHAAEKIAMLVSGPAEHAAAVSAEN